MFLFVCLWLLFCVYCFLFVPTKAPGGYTSFPVGGQAPGVFSFLKDPPPAKQAPRRLNKHPVGYTSFPVGGQAPGVLGF